MTILQFWLAYGCFWLLATYIISVSFSSDVNYFLPRFSVWREEVTGKCFVGGALLAAVPMVNVIFVFIALIGWLVSGDSTEAFFEGKPFSKYKDKR